MNRLPSAAPAAVVGAAAAADDAPERPSKSQRKRDMTALQALGTRLVALNADQLARVALPENLQDAVRAAQRITAHEARRRQLQYIGKLMRQVDAAPIEQALDELGGADLQHRRAQVALMHRCERWRDRLLDDDAALTALLAQYPAADVQPLRATIRGARRERDRGAAPRHTRELYRELHRLLAAAPAGSAADAGADAVADARADASTSSRTDQRIDQD